MPNFNQNNGNNVNSSDVTNLNDCTESELCLRYNNAILQMNADITSSVTDESRRHNSMDRLMGLFNDMGRTQRTRSLSDGGKDEGKIR